MMAEPINFEYISYEKFRSDIDKRYNKLGDSVISMHNNLTRISRSKYTLSQGCQTCKEGTWLCLFVGLRCNAACKFCSRKLINKHKDEPEGFQRGRTFKELVDSIISEGDKIKGVAYSGGEPFLYLDKTISIAGLLAKKKPSIYQWIYTNGKLLNEESLLRLKDVNIKEVRVNLAATDFDDHIVEMLPLVKSIIGKVTIEVPSIPETRHKLIEEKYLNTIVDMGVEQINLVELYIMRKEANKYLENKKIYSSKIGYLSPVESRNITIDAIEYVIENNLDLLVNDCSTDTKFLHGQKRKFSSDLYKIYS